MGQQALCMKIYNLPQNLYNKLQTEDINRFEVCCIDSATNIVIRNWFESINIPDGEPVIILHRNTEILLP